MEKVKQALAFVKKNWFAILITLNGVFIATEVLGKWAGWGVPFSIGFIALVVYMVKNRIKRK